VLSFSAFSEDESFIEIDLVNKLQSIVEKQREQIRNLDTSLLDIKSELDEVRSLIMLVSLKTSPFGINDRRIRNLDTSLLDIKSKLDEVRSLIMLISMENLIFLA
jgi:septation ring formation regulator EzrA